MHAMCVKRFARTCVRAFYTSARVHPLIMRSIFFAKRKKKLWIIYAIEHILRGSLIEIDEGCSKTTYYQTLVYCTTLYIEWTHKNKEN